MFVVFLSICFHCFRDVELVTPYPVHEQPQQLHHTYLDTIGRPVVTATVENLVEQHIQDFQVAYRFEKFMLLQEPLLVVGVLYLFFLSVIVFVRLDFSIAKVSELCLVVSSSYLFC